MARAKLKPVQCPYCKKLIEFSDVKATATTITGTLSRLCPHCNEPLPGFKERK